MKIGELARATGLNTRTIRFYEQEGLLPDPQRTSSGYRVYGPQDVDLLEFIRKAKRLGFSLEEIKSILHLHDRREPTCLHVRSLLEEKLAQVDRVLEDLQKFRAEIVRLREEAGDLVDCRPTGGRICGIIEGASLGAGPEFWPG
jgi:DNA-binding transcriptional MerR regulator